MNSRILRRVARETSIVLSSTFVEGSYVLRPCFINARTSTADVEAFLDTMVRLGDEITAELTAPELTARAHSARAVLRPVLRIIF